MSSICCSCPLSHSESAAETKILKLDKDQSRWFRNNLRRWDQTNFLEFSILELDKDKTQEKKDGNASRNHNTTFSCPLSFKILDKFSQHINLASINFSSSTKIVGAHSVDDTWILSL